MPSFTRPQVVVFFYNKVGNQQLMDPIDFHSMKKTQPFGYPHSIYKIKNVGGQTVTNLFVMFP